MGKMNEPPEVLGHSVGAALVGTFLGVLLCYGIVGPMATLIEHQIKEEESYFHDPHRPGGAVCLTVHTPDRHEFAYGNP